MSDFNKCVAACQEYRNKLEKLEAENAELRTYKANTKTRIAQLETENATWLKRVESVLAELNELKTKGENA